MSSPRVPSTVPFTRRLSVETPEHVVLEFELAGIGSRAAAALYDALLLAGLVFLFSIAVQGVLQVPVPGVRSWGFAVLLAAWFVTIWGYFVLFEALTGGRTPGKRRMGIRVVMDTGHPVTFSAAAVRNLLRLVDVQPGISYLVALVVAFLHPQGKRLGDIVAGTIVVRDRPEDQSLSALARPAEPDRRETAAPELDEGEFRILEQLLARLDQLTPEMRRRFVEELTGRFAPRFPNRPRSPTAFLAQLYRRELDRRRGIMAPRGPGAGSGDRFVAVKQEAWERFRRQAADVERRGLASLTGRELTAFAAAYREVAADLARARTYRTDPRVVEYLARLVSTGHNLLYGSRGLRRPRLGRLLLLRTLPASVYEGRWYVLAAALLFLLPGTSGYVLVRERPTVAYEVLPDEMIARAELGSAEAAAGRGYAETPSPFLPLVASSIIANNVQVAFGAFAFGITAGIGTVVILAFNGLFFGAVLGLFANHSLAGWLLTFVAGHGVLELTAIFIAGGAGLRVARALLAPGDVARRDALVIHGARAARMLGAAACLLLLAGVIEGFVSASAAPAVVKLGVSALSALLVVLSVLAGRQALAARGGAAPAEA